jgi:hypothetical protein
MKQMELDFSKLGNRFKKYLYASYFLVVLFSVNQGLIVWLLFGIYRCMWSGALFLFILQSVSVRKRGFS